MKPNLQKRIGKGKAYAQSQGEFIGNFEKNASPPAVFEISSDNLETIQVKHRNKIYAAVCRKINLRNLADGEKFLRIGENECVLQIVGLYSGMTYYTVWGSNFKDHPYSIPADTLVNKVVSIEEIKTPHGGKNPVAQLALEMSVSAVQHNGKVNRWKGGQNA
jgi:hypothetical protein